MSERRLAITDKEREALSCIQGLEASAFDLVTGARRAESGDYFLVGSHKAFEALASGLFDEIDHRLSPPARLRQIESVYCRIDPDCGDF